MMQTGTFVGPRVRICRYLENVGTRPAVLNRLADPEFAMDFYDRHGVWIAPDRPPFPAYHPMFIPPPPPPPDGEDISIYTILQPGERMENCASYDPPARPNLFQAVSTYTPTLDSESVVRRLQTGHAIIGRDFGWLMSPPCIVDTRRRSVRC